MPRTLVAALLAIGLLTAGCGDDGAPTSEASPSTTSVTSSSSVATSVAVVPPTSRGLPGPVTVEPLPAEIGARTVLSGEPPYRGVLGQIDPGRFVVAPVALPPAAAAAAVAPLTGLPLDDPSAAERPAILAKIDNTSKGRPQASLSQADLVYEEMIEGGFTRLAAVFHSTAPELGPVRSGRTTDIALLGSLARPVFAWSGANLVHAVLLREQSIVDLGAQSRGEYFRAADRPGTYDLMIDAATLHGIAADRGAGDAPPAHFEYRDDRVGLPATASAADQLTVTYPSVTASWSWSDPGWARTQGGEEHVDADGVRVVAANVLVAEVEKVATGSVDTAGATVFEQLFLGTGRAWVFSDGHVVEATWTKPSIDSVATWTTADGVPVPLLPGTTWVELVPAGSLAWT